MTVLSAALLLFLILDPLGNVPVFLSVLKPLPPKRQRVVLVRELLIALAVLMLFLWCGKYALELMHLRQESVSIAGGIVLFLIGIRMIFPRPEGLMGEIPDGEPFIVPLAIPLVAGPSGMAAVMLLGSKEPERLGEWSLALLVAWAATAAILLASPLLYRLLGRRALAAVERLMGMLLVAISVQMLLDGLSTYLTTAR
jgi:MarC family membrane protein